jgi:hypothetical protein
VLVSRAVTKAATSEAIIAELATLTPLIAQETEQESIVGNIETVNVGNTSITLAAPGNSSVIAPNTSNFQGGNATLGYTAILSDSSVADIQVIRALQNSVLPTTPRFVGDNEDAQSIAVAGFEFRVIAKTQMLEDKTATITIIGNETGGSVTIYLTVKKVTTATVNGATA